MFSEVFYSFVASRDSFRGALLRERFLIGSGFDNIDVVGVPDGGRAVGDVARQVARLRGRGLERRRSLWLRWFRLAAGHEGRGRREEGEYAHGYRVGGVCLGAVVSRSCYTW